MREHKRKRERERENLQIVKFDACEGDGKDMEK